MSHGAIMYGVPATGGVLTPEQKEAMLERFKDPAFKETFNALRAIPPDPTKVHVFTVEDAANAPDVVAYWGPKEKAMAAIASGTEDPLIACARELQAKRKEWLELSDRGKAMMKAANDALDLAVREAQAVLNEALLVDAEIEELRKKLHQLSGGK